MEDFFSPFESIYQSQAGHTLTEIQVVQQGLAKFRSVYGCPCSTGVNWTCCKTFLDEQLQFPNRVNSSIQLVWIDEKMYWSQGVK